MKIFLFSIIITFAFLCKVDAQEQYELDNIAFRGNNSISSSELKGIISSTESPNWFFKFLNNISESIGKPPVYFDSLKTPDDLKSLQNYYRDNGFFEAKFSYQYNFDKNDKEAEIIYFVNEGPQFQINKFETTGLENIASSVQVKLRDNVDEVDTTDKYSRNLIEKIRQPILTTLLDNGYMLVRPNPPQILIDTINNNVDVTLNYVAGNRYKIGEIRVEKNGDGKDFVEDTIIRRLVNIKTGEYYSSEKINKSQVRLYRSNLFSSVLVNTVIKDTSGNYVPLNVSADIGKLHELSPEIILNNQESTFNLGLGLSYTKKNFFGSARSFTLSGSFAVQDISNVDYSKLTNFIALGDTSIWGYLDGRAAIEQPFIFGKPIVTRLELYSTINKKREYKTVLYGSKISLDFELPKFVYFNSFQTYFSVDRSKYNFNPDYVRSVLKSKVSQQKADSLIANLGTAGQRVFISSIIGTELGANKTNNLLFPNNGYTVSLTFEEANLLPKLIDAVFGGALKPKAQFYRFMSKATYYPKIYSSPENAFGIKLKVGYLHPYSGQKEDVPLDYRFTAGGSNSVRGWRSRELIPPSQIDYSKLNAQNLDLFIKDFPVGGYLLLEGSIETRNRLIGPLGSALFIDFGNTWNKYSNVRFDNIAVAAGFGLRYYSSFAPIRLDLGFKAYDPVTKQHFFQKYKNTHIFQNFFNIVEFHIGIGEAF